MSEQYLKELDELIIAAEDIIDFKIIRRTIWDTDLEKIGLYRYRVYFRDGSLLELTERLVEEKGQLQAAKYRFHWQDKEGKLTKRWDNARHHPEISTFPHHLHAGSEGNVVAHTYSNALEILSIVIKEINKKSPD
jgi:hypothetical protein